MKISRKQLLLVFTLLAMIVPLTVFITRRSADSSSVEVGAEGSDAGKPRPMRIAFGVSSSISDFGWSHGQNQGRLALKARMLDTIETFLWEGVYETNDCERALQWFDDLQPDLAFVLGERNQSAVQAWAGQHPSTKIVQWYGTPQAPNLAACAILDHETAYLCGAAAAMTLETARRLAVLAPYGTRYIRWVANAFTLGARSVRENIEVEFHRLSTWYDPAAERAAIRSLARNGVAAVYVIAVAPVPAVTEAERVGLFVLSHFGDQSQFAPTRWLTGTERLWYRLYSDVVDAALPDTWQPETLRGGLQEGYVRLASFGPAVTPEAIRQVRDLSDSIISGRLQLFQGPLRDTQGAVRVPEGAVGKWERLVEQRWMVEGMVVSASDVL